MATVTLTAIDINPITVDLTGGNTNFIYKFSNIQWNVNVVLGEGETITSITTTCGNDTATSMGGIFMNATSNVINTSVVVSGSETPITAQVTLTNKNYTPLSYHLDTSSLTDDGKINFRITGNYWNNYFKQNEYNNVLMVKYRLKQTNDIAFSEWINITDITLPIYPLTEYTINKQISTLSYYDAYILQIQIGDRLKTFYSPEIYINNKSQYDIGLDSITFNVPVNIPGGGGLPVASADGTAAIYYNGQWHAQTGYAWDCSGINADWDGVTTGLDTFQYASNNYYKVAEYIVSPTFPNSILTVCRIAGELTSTLQQNTTNSKVYSNLQLVYVIVCTSTSITIADISITVPSTGIYVLKTDSDFVNKVSTDNQYGKIRGSLLPITSPNSLGAVQASLKSNSMTQSVGVDTNGALWTNEGLHTATQELTDSKKIIVWNNQQIIKTETDTTLIAGAQYLLGEQQTVTLNLPNDALPGQCISVVFYSGSTATVLNISGNTIGAQPVPTSRQRIELSFIWDTVHWALLYNTLET